MNPDLLVLAESWRGTARLASSIAWGIKGEDPSAVALFAVASTLKTCAGDLDSTLTRADAS